MKWKRHWGSWLEMKYCIINTQEYCFLFRSRHRRSRELHVHSGEVTGGTPSHPGQAHDPYGRPVQQSWWVTVGATGRREQHHINKRHACLAAQSCPTLCNSFACSPPASSVHGIFQARILEWVAISYLRGSFWPRDQTQVSCIVGTFFTMWATRETDYLQMFYVFMAYLTYFFW